jgi:hypothetical protein
MAWAGPLVLGMVFFLRSQPAHALGVVEYSLKSGIRTTQVFTAKVESFDPQNKLAVIALGAPLKKDQPPFAKVSVTFANPDPEFKDHADKMLKRLAADLPLVVFYQRPRNDNPHVLIGYTNGTWIRLEYEGKEPSTDRWRFLHAELHFRQMFKGTTDELKQTIVDHVSGKKEAPKSNPKEEPGFGPEVP